MISLKALFKQSIEDINAALVAKFKESKKLFWHFINVCGINQTAAETLFSREALLPNIKDYLNDVRHFEIVITEVVRILYGSKLLIFSTERVYNLADFASLKDETVYILYEEYDIYYPILYLPHGNYVGEPIELNYAHNAADSMFKNIVQKLMSKQNEEAEETTQLLANIKTIWDIEYYYQNGENAIYSVHVYFRDERFYFPIPLYIGDEPNVSEIGPGEFASLNNAIDFMKTLGLEAKICVDGEMMFGFYIFKTMFFIKEMDININMFADVSDVVIDYKFDHRQVAVTLGASFQKNYESIDAETELLGRCEIGKELSFLFYTLVVTRFLQTNKEIKNSPVRAKFREIMENKKFSNKTVSIVSSDIFSEDTKKILSDVVTNNHDIDQIILQEDFEIYRSMDRKGLLNKIEKITKNVCVSVNGDSTVFQEYIGRPLDSSDKLKLTQDMIDHFPGIYLDTIVNIYAGNIIQACVHSIFQLSNNTHQKTSKVIDIEHMRSALKSRT